MSDTQYPLSDKFERVSDLAHAITSFLEWAEKQKGLSLCEPYKPQYSWYVPIFTCKEQLLLEFFGIDLAALEREKPNGGRTRAGGIAHTKNRIDPA